MWKTTTHARSIAKKSLFLNLVKVNEISHYRKKRKKAFSVQSYQINLYLSAFMPFYFPQSKSYSLESCPVSVFSPSIYCPVLYPPSPLYPVSTCTLYSQPEVMISGPILRECLKYESLAKASNQNLFNSITPCSNSWLSYL
jgi:hypothetical protein